MVSHNNTGTVSANKLCLRPGFLADSKLQDYTRVIENRNYSISMFLVTTALLYLVKFLSESWHSLLLTVVIIILVVYMVSVLVNEFFVYPLFRDRLPSILKRIGVCSFLSSSE